MFSMNYETRPEYSSSPANSLVHELVSARNRGVDVYVVMDDWYDHNKRTARYLEKNNIPVKIIQMDGSTHDKLIIIDGRIVVVGSTNWSYHSLAKNHEADVVINNQKIASDFESYFHKLTS